MNYRMLMYLNGLFMFETEGQLPEHNPELSFEDNCIIRDQFIVYKKTEFRIMYLKQSLKCNNNYEIYLLIESRMRCNVE